MGGGYFLALGDYGCVIDPGHHFLENFYKPPRTLADIDCVIVTHFHDDHYSNLPALLSLLYQRWKRDGRQVRRLCWMPRPMPCSSGRSAQAFQVGGVQKLGGTGPNER